MLRAIMSSLLSRKVRLVLSGLAVILGVMFVAGAFVLTDTLGRSFTALFSTAYQNVDVQVAATPKVSRGDGGDGSDGTTVPASLLNQVRAVPGVADVTGEVRVDGARVVGSDGKVVTTLGAPRYGVNWTGVSDLVTLRGGRAPQADNEVAMDAGLVKAADLHVGQQVGILTRAPKQTFTLVGVFGYSGGRDSLGGEQTVAFTTPVAQRLMLGAGDEYSAITVRAGPGESNDALRDRITATLGSGYEVRTGKQLADDAAASFQKNLSFFNDVLLGFAGVALFVGTFLILNTFSIIVAQRTRELALLRSMGASRRQVIGSVLLEALVIGVIAAALGLLLGIGVGAGLAYLFGSMGAGGAHLAGIGVPAAAIIGSFAVGILITLVAALVPALRAARVAPIAAMRDAAVPDRPLTRITVAGGAVLAVGAALLGVGLSGRTGGTGTLWLILGGVLVSFIGAAMLTPVVARPVVALLGRPFSWSVPGQLGRRNSARNPRRTAITAGALMVGIALITGVNVILTSATASIRQVANDQVKVDLIISGQQSSDIPPTFDPAVVGKAGRLPGVHEVAAFYGDRVMLDGAVNDFEAIDNPRALHDMFGLSASSGRIDTIGAGQVVVDAKQAKSHNIQVGGTVTVQESKGAPKRLTVVGVYADNDVMSGWIGSTADIDGFRVTQPVQGFVTLAPGAAVAPVRAGLNTLLADSPEVRVSDRSEFVKQQTDQFNTVLTMIQILLALAILIAVLGIVNTMALSVLERTRELGLLRAIGLRRAQAMRMVTVEAVVISVFGAILGLLVGSGLGTAVVHALRGDGFSRLAYPWTQMGWYLVLSAMVGVVAAVLPAIRAARVNVLTAIAYE